MRQTRTDHLDIRIPSPGIGLASRLGMPEPSPKAISVIPGAATVDLDAFQRMRHARYFETGRLYHVIFRTTQGFFLLGSTTSGNLCQPSPPSHCPEMRTSCLKMRQTRTETHALYARYSDEIVRLMERPSGNGWVQAGHLGWQWLRLKQVLSRAANAFADVERRRPRDRAWRRVFASGDLLTKGNDFANGGIYRLLAQKGLRILFEPTCDFIEFVVRANPRLLFGKGASALTMTAYRVEMVAIREALYNLVRGRHPWLPVPDVAAVLERSKEMIDPATNSGAPLAVGSVLWHWGHDRIEGVVMSACWGCDSGLVEESLLRHLDDIPFYFHYDDGTPIDERRIAGYAFRLHQSPPREQNTDLFAEPCGPQFQMGWDGGLRRLQDWVGGP